DNYTALHVAVQSGKASVVETLLGSGADIHVRGGELGQTALHIAASLSGPESRECAMMLLKSGGQPDVAQEDGETCLHLAARNGNKDIMKLLLNENANLHLMSNTGETPLHVAAKSCNYEAAQLIVTHMAQTLSPEEIRKYINKRTNDGFTAVHYAAEITTDQLHFPGEDAKLMNLLIDHGGQVDLQSLSSNETAMHMAARSGNQAVLLAMVNKIGAGTVQIVQNKQSKNGWSPLLEACSRGHTGVAQILLQHHARIDVFDDNGRTALHLAALNGHLQIVHLLLQHKAFVNRSAGQQLEFILVPLCFAAAHNHIECLRFLLKQKHDTHQLMEDRRFVFDLMVCGKGNDNEPLQEFILQSPAPIDTAVKLSALYREGASKDLSNVAVFSENMAVELLSITATEYNAAILLKAKDNRGRPLLDVLIENEQKEVVSYASVQRYLTEIWTARVDWSFGKTVAFSLFVLICPPAWFYFSLPLDSRIGRAPIIKFVCHIVSHVYFTILLTVVVLNITHKMYEVTSVIPNPVEWLLLLWLSGNLVSELSNVGGGSGLGIVKVLILVLSAAAIAVHVLAFLLPAVVMTHLDNDEKLHFARTMLYLKNQLFAFALLFAFVEYLDFLTVHHLFGPWAIIIRDLMYDLARFLVILLLFVAGFTLHVTSIFQPAYQPLDEDSAELMRLASPEQTLEMLFFSLFGLVEPDSMPPLHLVPDFAKIILKLLFGIYMMVTLIVLINLLIAMMSDTYQRIHRAQSTELGLKVRVCTQKAQQDLRFEENIDAFSMGGGHQGRTSPTMREDGTVFDTIRDNYSRKQHPKPVIYEA
ncbi:ankyrin repeat protein, partial [Ostertagia ostertagi]